MYTPNVVIIEKEKPESGCGCGWLLITTMLGSLAIIGISVVYLCIQIPKWADQAVPYIESKGRVLLGKFSLECLYNTVDESDLTRDEKDRWTSYIDRRWEIAYKSDDTSLSRERMIDEARATVRTLPGCYYALNYMLVRRLKTADLTPSVRDRARKTLKQAMKDLQRGRYSEEQIEPIYSAITTITGGWHTSTEVNGVREDDHLLREVCRHFYRLHKAGDFQGDHVRRNMLAEFRKELKDFEKHLEYYKRKPGNSDGQPTHNPKETVPDTLIDSLPE